MSKILIIEDEKVLREMYSKKLSQEGFDVVLAFNVEKGLASAKKEKPDLILLDILLPEKSGVDFLKELRKDEDKELSSITVLAFSNYDDAEIKKRILDLGAVDYLIKTNHTPQEIIDKIKKYLR